MMSQAQFMQEEAARLIVEGGVFRLIDIGGTTIFRVEDETQTYRVHLKPDGTESCTCSDWTRWGERCLHILASQFCQYVHEVVR